MREILFTSSVLILVLLLLRRLFREKISRRVQYALWGLVLVRLLVPGNLPAIQFSVLTAAQPVREQVRAQIDQREVYFLPINRTPASNYPLAEGLQPGDIVPTANSFGYYILNQDGKTVTTYADKLTIAQVLALVWKTGIVGMTGWLIASNLLFWAKLRRRRRPYPVEGCKHRVYLVEQGLPSPCLFGVVRPAVYLTPAAVESPERLGHVLVHEETHARHLDPLWSLLRGICLVIYWFDPLVWWAALASRKDCELACDEGALARLGEEERIPYGHTLLALIPVRRGPGSPLLSATTMTAGKRELKDRITRIAQGHRTVAAALAAALLLTCGACALTFTGAPAGDMPQNGPLSAQELDFFNQEFFNGYESNLHNRFLTSLYDRPEEIDLYELLYDGCGEAITQEEMNVLMDGEWLGVWGEKHTTSSINQLLLENTGLTLEQTNQVRLDEFRYLPEYDGYFHLHGDTNYPGEIVFLSGTRQGEQIRLYYDASGMFLNGDFIADGATACVTLQQNGGDGYFFVSHRIVEAVALPTAYPEGEPLLTIPLHSVQSQQILPAALETYQQALPGSSHWDSYPLSGSMTLLVSRLHNGICVQVDNGSTKSSQEPCILKCLGENTQIDYFINLFGYDGFILSYEKPTEYPDILHDYYAVSEQGDILLLAQTYGQSYALDLNGDGTKELIDSGNGSGPVIYFQQKGQIFRAEVETLIQQNSLETQLWSVGELNIQSRCFYASALANKPGQDPATLFGLVYFDGEHLRLYPRVQHFEDHVATNIHAPADVIEAVKDFVKPASGAIDAETGEWGNGPERFDDWRVTNLEGAFFEQVGEEYFLLYRYNYEYHTTTPNHITLAGGRYITEDDWVSPGYSNHNYLVFRTLEDGSHQPLFPMLENDCGPGSEMFYSDLVWELEQRGLIAPSETG